MEEIIYQEFLVRSSRRDANKMAAPNHDTLNISYFWIMKEIMKETNEGKLGYLINDLIFPKVQVLHVVTH